MLRIQEYLRAPSEQTELESVLEELEVFSGTDSKLIQLEAEYGIKSRRHGEYPNLILLKYNQVESPFDEEIVQECRGIILDEDDNFRVVSMPYTKFFNYGESLAAPVDWSTARVWEKLDGSLVTIYFYDGRWHVATSGTPDANCDINGSDLTFSQLFWDVVDKDHPEMIEKLNPQNCYMFELCAPENRVVVPHMTRRIFLHGVRDLESLEEEHPEEWAEHLGLKLPKVCRVDDINAVLRMVEDMSGLEQEGFVVCDAHFNRLKVKCDDYVRIHRAKDGFSEKNIAELVRMNESSEYLVYFPKMVNIYNKIEERYKKLIVDIENTWEKTKDIEGQKDFALKVKDLPYSGLLFEKRRNGGSTKELLIKMKQPLFLRLVGVK